MEAVCVPGAPSPTTCFADLPFELRREIWHHHFNGRRHIRIISSANNTAYPPANPPPIPLHFSLDATTNAPLHLRDIARPSDARYAHSEARNAFLETQVIADLATCGPGLASYSQDQLERYAHGQLCVAANRGLLSRAITGYQVKFECEALLKRDIEAGAVRFPVCMKSDLVYFLDYQNGRMFSKLCGSSWMPKVKQIALAVADGRYGPGVVWNNGNMGDEIRRHNQTEGRAQSALFMSGKAGRFSTFYLVVIPETTKGTTSSRWLDIEHDEFGFAALEDCAGRLSQWEMSQAIEVTDRVTAQIKEAFPPGDRPYEIRAVVDIDFVQPIGDVTYKRRPRVFNAA